MATMALTAMGMSERTEGNAEKESDEDSPGRELGKSNSTSKETEGNKILQDSPSDTAYPNFVITSCPLYFILSSYKFQGGCRDREQGKRVKVPKELFR